MKVLLQSYTNIFIASDAIRQCHNTRNKADYGRKDLELIDRVGNKLKHSSTLEHIVYTFDIDGISRACYSEDTEVLTNEGWKLFKDLNGNEKFLTRNDKTGKAEFQKATDYIAYHYKGKMHRYKNQTIDLLVTPNHRLMFKRAENDVRKETEKIHYMKSEDINFKRIRIPKTINFNGDGVVFNLKDYCYIKHYKNSISKEKRVSFKIKDNNAFLQLIAAYLSDGVTYFDKKERKYVITIYTPHKEKHTYIKNICKKLDIHTVIDKNNKYIRFNNRVIGEYFNKIGKSYKKYVPFNIWDLTEEQAKLFLNTYLIFDGTEKKDGSCALYTSSKKLSDDLFNICLIAGYSPNMHIIDNVGKQIKIAGNETKVNRIVYQIAFSKKKKRNIDSLVSYRNKNSKFKEEEDYNGVVYCVSVPNTNLFVRREGTGNACWCGNCLQELARHRIASLTVKSTRYTLSELKKTVTEVFLPDGSISDELYSAVSKFCVIPPDLTFDEEIHIRIALAHSIGNIITSSLPNDKAKYMLPEAYKTSLTWTINARSLQNFLTLRSDKSALWEMRKLSKEIYNEIPSNHKFLFTNCIKL